MMWIPSSALRVVSVLLVLVVAGIPGVVFAQESNTVMEIAIAGNKNINTDTIRNAIGLQRGDRFTPEVEAADKEAIMSLGLFTAVTVIEEDVPGGIKVTYEVTENPKISCINIVGSGPVEPETLLALMKTRPGQVLNTTTLDQDIEAIRQHYYDLGYLAYPTEDIDVSPEGVLTIPILVHVVESLEITGNKKTRSYVFLREMKTKPGDYYNVNVLKEDIMRIYNLDILEDIKPYEPEPGSEIGLIRITIPVVEKKTGQISVGFGYSSRQRLVGQARLSESNFRGKGQGVNFLWEQGTSEAVGGSSSYELGFYEPWLDDRHTSLQVSAYNKILYRFSSGLFGSGNFDGESYNERHKGGDLTLSRPVTDDLRVHVGGKFESVLTDPNLLNPADDLYKIVQDGDIGLGSIRAVHSTRDFELDPASGGYEALSFEFGTTNSSRFVLDATQPSGFATVPFEGTFTKTAVDLRRYFSRGGPKRTPQDKRVTLAVRLRAGVASGTVPFFEQFFVGGGESLRGYKEDRFWGNKMLLASVELRKPIAQSITGVVFADYGDAWGGNPDFFITELQQSENFEGTYGVGVGMRVATPIGNLRLDYAVGTEGGRTHFSMGHAF